MDEMDVDTVESRGLKRTAEETENEVNEPPQKPKRIKVCYFLAIVFHVLLY